MAVELVFPPIARRRGPGYWLQLPNLWAARRRFLREDRSLEWRRAFEALSGAGDPTRSLPFSRLLDRPASGGFRFAVLGDTGEGDRSQLALLPLLRALAPDFLVIAGDVAYPAGSDDDFGHGFFAPYRGLGVPIWAVPGNHEYYSPLRGREFFDVFCGRASAATWEASGLRLVPQPGSYWELREAGVAPLVLLGLDTGMEACLDGDRRRPPDDDQLLWLEDRLRAAERDDLRVMVLLHIPGLVKGDHDRSTSLTRLHRVLASFRCVRMIVGGHEHNYQRYAPPVFAEYLRRQHGVAAPAGPIEYLISGGGGAFLHGTDFAERPYPTSARFPDPRQWRSYASLGRRIVDSLGLAKTLIGAVAGRVEAAALADGDLTRFLSFLLVEVDAQGVRVVPVFLDDVATLYRHLPAGTVVRVDDPRPSLDPEALRSCLQPAIEL